MQTHSNKCMILTLAAGLALGSPGIASAQADMSSGTTLYGLVDISVSSAKGNKYKRTGLMDGTSYGPGSRWGLRVNEDLGSGWKIGALLESGFSAITGESQQGNRLFGRQAYLWLRSDDVGELRLGRQYIMHEQTIAAINPTVNSLIINPEAGFDYDDVGGTRRVVRPMQTIARVDGAMQYYTPRFYGLQAQFMYASSGSDAQGLYRGYRLNYLNAPLYLVASYDAYNAVEPQVSGKSGINKTTMFGGSYDFGVVKVFAGYQGVKNLRHNTGTVGSYPLPGLTVGLPATQFKSFNVGASIPVDDITYAVNFSHARYENAIGQDMRIGNYGAAATWHLSKRSEIYGAVAFAGGSLKSHVYQKRIAQLGLRQRF